MSLTRLLLAALLLSSLGCGDDAALGEPPVSDVGTAPLPGAFDTAGEQVEPAQASCDPLGLDTRGKNTGLRSTAR